MSFHHHMESCGVLLSSFSISKRTEVFIFVGEEDWVPDDWVPDDVVSVLVAQWVTEIPHGTFSGRSKLKTVELCDGVEEIGAYAFNNCTSLEEINFPPTIKRVGDRAFYQTAMKSFLLPDSVESIGREVFYSKDLCPKFRTPPLIKEISMNTTLTSQCAFSVELPVGMECIGTNSFVWCSSLRNIALPCRSGSLVVQGQAFLYVGDLQRLFGPEDSIVDALSQRFHELPIHRMMYYQSYNPVTAEHFNEVANLRSGQMRRLRNKLDPTGRQQDCLGMTPLHIMACSTTSSRADNLALFEAMIEKYPENLISKDRWGALPLLYLIWGKAHPSITRLLIKSYLQIYPEYQLNWDTMLYTLGKANAPLDVIKLLLFLQDSFFPEQSIDRYEVLVMLALDEGEGESFIWEAKFRSLVLWATKDDIEGIRVKSWRDDVKRKIDTIGYRGTGVCARFIRRAFLMGIFNVIGHYQTEYKRLEEGTSILELALWKAKIDEVSEVERQRQRKKRKHDDWDLRHQCRTSCGANIVIKNVLTWLWFDHVDFEE